MQAKSLKNAIANAFGAMSDILQSDGKSSKAVSAPKVMSEILQSDKLTSEKLARENFGHANTKNNNTNNTLFINNSIYNQHPLCGDNGLRLSTTYTKRKVCELIDYNFQTENIQATAELKSMCKEFRTDKERAVFEKKAIAMLDELTKQITTMLNLKSSTVFVGDEEVDALELKASLLEKLNKETIMELLQRAIHYSKEVRSIKAYMSTSVYNFAVC